MTVRKTESRIPGGFTLENAKKLGQADLRNNYALISYLESPLRTGIRGDYTKYLKNTYIVFINTETPESASPSYRWNVAFYSEEVPPVYTFDTIPTDQAIFVLDTEEDSTIRSSLEGNTIIKIIVSVYINGSSEPLSLEHAVQGLSEEIETFIEESAKSPGAMAGTPEITRLLANDYRNHLINQQFLVLGEEEPDKTFPVNLVASVFYLNLLADFSVNMQEYGDSDWADYINKGVSSPFLTMASVGPAQISPYFLAMFLKPEGASDPLTEYLTWNSQNSYCEQEPELNTIEQYETKVFDNFDHLEIKHKIDIFNLLRFPKSSLRLCGFFLKELRDLHEEWKDLSILDMLKNENIGCVHRIVSEYNNVPVETFIRPSSFSKKTYNLLFSPFIQEIVKTSFVQYEIIRVHVLDIRSGEPINNARVKKLVISTEVSAGTSHMIGNNILPYSGENLPNTFLGGQKALNYLGFNHGGESVRKQYNKYWASRVPNNSVERVDSGNPTQEMLNYIIKEYNSHRATDDNGILHIRIPTILLQQKKVHIDIGFWEFPITLECLKENTSSGYPICRSETLNTPRSGATQFNVSWIGDQELGWNDNANDSKHFGWVVHNKDNVTNSNLKVATRLIVKHDTNDFSQFDNKLFSKYFEQTGNHFVVFGMQWCQPLFDEIEDPTHPNRTNLNVFVSRKDDAGNWVRNAHMHIVTKHYGGNEFSKGQYYGFYDRNPFNHEYRGPGRRHDAVDIYSGVDGLALCYAIHGGIFNKKDSVSFGMKSVKLKFNYCHQTGTDNKIALYAHLSSREPLENKVVCAGQIIGTAGRLGTAFSSSREPSHLHMQLTDDGGTNNSSLEPQTYLAVTDTANAVCLPSNKLPQMLPCACVYGAGISLPVGCNFANNNVVKTCWAIQKYPEYDYVSVPRGSTMIEFPEPTINGEGIYFFACPYVLKDSTSTSDRTSADEDRIPVNSIEKLPSHGWVQIGDEAIEYGELAENALVNCSRGCHDTTAATHAVGSTVTFLDFSSYGIQAQLKFIYVNENKLSLPDSFDPGALDGKLGGIPATVNVDWKIGEQLTLVGNSEYDTRLVQVQCGGKIGWIGAEVMDVEYKLKYELKQIPANSVSSSRMAMYVLRKAKGQLIYDNYAKNFDVNLSLVQLLNSVIL